MHSVDIFVKDQDVLGGTPVFRGTRVSFQASLDYPEAGQTLHEFLDDFPTASETRGLRRSNWPRRYRSAS
jgi:uncharacterized protein (DUF433 family)